MATETAFNLYEFPDGFTGRKTYVSVRGHDRSVPVIYTYRGRDGLNRILPEYGGDGDEGAGRATMIMRDIGEYRSVVDGTMITSRSSHREHMARHDLIEVGNERIGNNRREEAMPRMGTDIKRAIEQLRARA